MTDKIQASIGKGIKKNVQRLPRPTESGFAHLGLLIAVGVVVVVIGLAVVAKQNYDRLSAQQSQQTAAGTTTGQESKASTQTTPTPTPSPAQGTPRPTASATPQATPTPTPATITHPTQANCNNQSFTVYASASGGTKQYYAQNTGSKVVQTVAYGQSFKVMCGNYTAAGWALAGNNYVQFTDVSLTKP